MSKHKNIKYERERRIKNLRVRVWGQKQKYLSLCNIRSHCLSAWSLSSLSWRKRKDFCGGVTVKLKIFFFFEEKENNNILKLLFSISLLFFFFANWALYAYYNLFKFQLKSVNPVGWWTGPALGVKMTVLRLTKSFFFFLMWIRSFLIQIDLSYYELIQSKQIVINL